MNPLLRIIAMISASLLLSHSAWAHLFAPSLLKISEVSPQSYQVVWKTPAKITSNIPLQPIWPVGCDSETESSPMTEGTGIVSSWQLVCEPSYEQGLVGQILGVSGLGVNQVSAMVILNLRDGRHYQQILTAETPQFRVPLEPSQNQVMTEYSVLGAEHIWGGIDHLMFVFGLLLLIGVGAGWRLMR